MERRRAIIHQEMTKSALKYDGKTDSWILNPFSSCKETTTIIQYTNTKPSHNFCTDLLHSALASPSHKPSPSCASVMEPRNASTTTTQSSCRIQGKFWQFLMSSLTCFGAATTEPPQNNKKHSRHSRNSSVHSVGSTSPLYATPSSPGDMSAEERDENIKSVILYCNNNSKH